MTNYKQYPLETVEMLRDAIQAMYQATDDDKFLTALNTTAGFPLALSLDDANYAIERWANDIIEKYQWQPPTEEELYDSNTARNAVRYFIMELIDNMNGSAVRSKVCALFDRHVDDCERNIAETAASTLRTVTELDAEHFGNLAEDLANIIMEYSHNKPTAKTIDRTSPSGKLQLVINSLNSLRASVMDTTEFGFIIEQLAHFVVRIELDEMDMHADPTTNHEALEQQGWNNYNAGGGHIVWYKDFVGVDGVVRMAGIDGESDGLVYDVTYHEYMSMDDEDVHGSPVCFANALYDFQKMEIMQANKWV